jgi:fibrillarin-like pre-rRNA processing protein
MRYRLHPHRFRGVFTDGKNIFTENTTPGTSVYGESLVKDGESEYRRWEPARSKLSALIRKGCSGFPFEKRSAVLYLGAASGTTVSHVSDIAKEGTVFAVEVSRIPFQKLLFLAESRKNIIPIMADAAFPGRYGYVVPQVDVLYQDIAQRDQLSIFRKNLTFLCPGGTGIIMVKARSIDVTVEPKDIYKRVEDGFRADGLKVLEKKELAPFEKDHAAIVVRK